LGCHIRSIIEMKKHKQERSNWMSYHLRHNADLLTDPSGWVTLERLAKFSPDFRRIPESHIIDNIVSVVGLDKKGRYALDTDNGRIRATNGHSVALTSPIVRRLSKDERFPWAVHGTNEEAWVKIQQHGALSRMTRDYIHFAVDPAHFRPDNQIEVYLYLDVAALLNDGRELLMTTNGVLASEADVPVQYISAGPKPKV
jgi:RNA:NAD 2'-phosphotransferase (TPT1/KptA family)